MEASAIKSMNCKRNYSNGDVTRPCNREFSEEMDADGEEPVEGAHAEVHPCNQGPKLKKLLCPQPKSCTNKLQENELEQKKAGTGHGKAASDAMDGADRLRRCKQQNSQENYGSNLRHQQEVPSQQQKCIPIIRRRQRQGPRSLSEQGRVGQCTRTTLKRSCDSGTSLPPNPLAGKGIKRSRRVAQRLAQEEPPPLPLKLPTLHLVLTRKEIQEDWIKITGQKYAGKPRKSTLVQKGLGLCTALTCPSSIEYLSEPHCKLDFEMTVVNSQG